MEKQFAEIYNKMAEKISSMIPADWYEIYYLGGVSQNKSHFCVFYFNTFDNDEFTRSFDIPKIYKVSEEVYLKLHRELNAILLELYNCFELNKQQLWREITFYFNSNGKFKVDFEYNYVEDLGTLKREVIRAYETCNYVFKNQTKGYIKNSLDEYIKQKESKEIILKEQSDGSFDL